MYRSMFFFEGNKLNNYVLDVNAHIVISELILAQYIGLSFNIMTSNI